MGASMSSRERMLAALSNQEPDYVPCSFMIFMALREQCRDQFEFIERQIDMGLDTVVGLPVRPAKRDRSTSEQGDLHGLPVRFDPAVEVEDWREDRIGERYPILHRKYTTPEGPLVTSVNMTEDWLQGERVPLFDDYVIPRARKPLVTGGADLPALRCLFAPPTDEDIAEFQSTAQPAKELAAKHDLLTIGEWGVLFDAACWLCGIEELAIMTIEQPELVDELFDIISAWDRQRMEIVLREGVDLFIRRAWYECADFWPPQRYAEHILPHLKKDVELAHSAGSQLALITTCSYTPLLDLYLEAGIDVLIGLDPVQDVRVDFALTKEKVGQDICLWGGVSGAVTVELGSPEEVRQATLDAMHVLAPGGGFILSPVDNVRIDAPHVWQNLQVLLDTWRSCREY